jgi:hypothetical protein
MAKLNLGFEDAHQTGQAGDSAQYRFPHGMAHGAPGWHVSQCAWLVGLVRMMCEQADEVDRADAGGKQGQLAAGAAQVAVPVQFRHQVGDRDIDEAGGGDHQDIGHGGLHAVQSKIAGDAAEHHGDPGQGVQGQCPGLADPGAEQHHEVTDLLGQFVAQHGNGRGPAEARVGEKGGGDQDTIDEVMQAIADDDHRHPGWMRGIGVATVAVIVAPERGLFQQEKRDDAGQQQLSGERWLKAEFQ